MSLLETLAEIEHEQWVAWSKDIANNEKITPKRLERWKKYWIPYKNLPDEIKEEDRKWALLVIAEVKKHLGVR